MAYMANNEELQSSLSNVPSTNLNELITHLGLHQYPEGMMPATSSISTQNSTDVIHTSSLNLAQSIEIGQLPHTTMTSANEAKKNPSIDVVIENRMVRFRYDSELNNRNYGKEVLAKIVVYDYTGRVKVRIHAVDDKKFRAHPFCLIGDKCVDGVYIEEHDIAPDKKECICKATPRIPKQKNYDMELNNRKKIMMDPNRFPFITSDMERDDYWSSNKNIKESKEIILMVEVFFSAENTSLGTSAYLYHHSNPINNAKDGKKFEVYAISPLTSSVLGSPNSSHFIILTSDSYSPAESDIEVRFCDEGNWCETTTGKVIKNAIEFQFPGYSDALSVNKTVYVSVYDKKRKIETSKKELTLLPTDGDIIAHKRKKMINFTIGDYKEGVKQEQRSSCNNQRRIHHLKKKPPSQSAGSPLDFAKLEEEGMISLNISSPMSQNESCHNSTSNSLFMQPAASATFSNFNNPSTTLAGSIPNTIPAILAPSGARDMQARSTMSDYQLGANGSDNKDLANNVAFSQNSQGNILQTLSNIQVVGNNTQDISQEQTLSISQLNNLLQYPDVLRLLGLSADGSAPQAASAPSGSFNQMNTDQFANTNTGYDPHDIRLEDFVDEIGQNDIEIDCEEISSSTEKEEISSSTEKEESCEKCKNENDKSEQKKEKDVSSSKNSKDKVSEKKVPEKKTESKNEKSVIQSAVISSNVDSDIEEG